MARQRSGRRTDYEWGSFGDLNLANTLVLAGTFGVTVLDFTRAGTIMRIRGKVTVDLDAGGVDERGIILCGLMVGNTDLVQATAVAPELLASVDEGRWLWQGQLYVSSGAEAAIVLDRLSDSIEVDTKAMARIKAGQSLAFVYESPAALTTDQGGTFDIGYYLHVLTGH